MLTLKKSLGQHFLHDENMCLKIVGQLQRKPGLNLLEVGPGGGALTKYLASWEDVDYKAIELDEEKVLYLGKTFPDLQGKVLHKDFLKAERPFHGPFSIIGNFPYNISTQIVFKVLDWKTEVEEVIGMFQKEVAVRIASPHGSKAYGILSVLTQAFYKVEYLFDVPPACFNPPPKVMSGVLRMTYIGNPYKIEQYHEFVKIVKAAFGQRRKMLRNGLKGLLPPETLAMPMFSKRAEQLPVADFVTIYEMYLNR